MIDSFRALREKLHKEGYGVVDFTQYHPQPENEPIS
jgi:hypothetical protein